VKLQIVYRNLRFEVDVPLEKSGTKGIPTVGGALAGVVTAPILGAVNLVRRAFAQGGEPPRPTTRRLAVLDGVSGTLRAGTMTLVLAAAGHGKSTLLKSVSQRLVARVSDAPVDSLAPLPPNTLCGTLTYAGSSVAEAEAAGVSVPRLVAYVPQTDEHYPSLTVAETLHFAAANVRAPWVPPGQQHQQGHTVVSADASSPRESAADEYSTGSALAREQAAAALADPAVAVAQVLRLLKLEECEHTVLGNEVLKGCSGGQRKRVTIAESLLGHARVLCLDEISNGLDASMTGELVACLRTWARAMRGTVLATLQQPTPETFRLFDGLILLREGRVLYHGPRDRVREYFSSIGFAPPAEAAPAEIAALSGTAAPSTSAALVADGQSGHHADLADWLVELCSHPQAVWARPQPGERGGPGAYGALDSTEALAAAWARHCGADGCLDASTLRAAAAMAEGCEGQPGAAPAMAVRGAEAGTVHLRGAPVSLIGASAPATSPLACPGCPGRPARALTTDFARAQFGLAYPRSHWSHLRLLIGRQLKLTRRDLPFLFARVGGGIIMALVLGSLFYRTGLADFGLKLGCALFAIIHISFGSGIEVPAIIDQRFVQYKQLAARMYPAYCSVLGYWLALFPM
jgi:ABC-type multidrug transport system ATPase subunit